MTNFAEEPSQLAGPEKLGGGYTVTVTCDPRVASFQTFMLGLLELIRKMYQNLNIK